MIIFDLKCEQDHSFEGWFKDRAAFEEQQTNRLISCPVCGGFGIRMVPSSVSVMGRDAKLQERQGHGDLSPAKAMQLLHQHLERHFDDVGEQFAEVALRIHHGEEDRRNIKGSTTSREEELLRKEGVPFIKIPIPKFDS